MPQTTLDLTKALIQRPSITPDDAGCQQLIADRLSKLGFNVESFEIKGVTNLWARLGDQKPLFAFAGHTDVVPTGDESLWQFPPFEAYIEDDWLFGRGAVDMKGGLAAMITATERFLANHDSSQLKGSLAFLITSDEEGPSIHGTKAVLEILSKRNEIPDWCLIGEPSSESTIGDVVKVGRRGSVTGYLTIRGKQGHVAYPHLAVNPIHHAMTVLNDIIAIQWPKSNELFPETSLQLANIQAGTGASNVIPEQLVVNFNVRFAPPLTANDIIQAVESKLLSSKAQFEIQWRASGEPFYTNLDSPFIKAVVDTIETEQSISPDCCTKGGTSDGRFFAPYGTHVAELGLVNKTIHQIDEKTKIQDLDILSNIYEKVLVKLLA